MYLGEITRLVLVSLIDATPVMISPAGKKPQPILFGGRGSSVVNKIWGLDSSVMSEIEEAWRGEDDKELSHEKLPFEEDELSEATKRRLAKVREVVVKRFGYQDEQVGLWDAAVSYLL
jgi:hexokinase